MILSCGEVDAFGTISACGLRRHVIFPPSLQQYVIVMLLQHAEGERKLLSHHLRYPNEPRSITVRVDKVASDLDL